MKWNKLISAKRYGQEHITLDSYEEMRSQFQRDYDRLIFSSAFRRLQNKTQVFALPKTVFVHNRLTHSLEVSTVGRSLGNILSEKIKTLNLENDNALIEDIGSIVAASCLAHDLGNPPFGHSGEKAISHYFSEGTGLKYKNLFNKEEWADITNFEGNANALRLLTHTFKGKREGGFSMTYSSIAAVIKYPWASIDISPKGKFGFFQTEKDTMHKIALELGLYNEEEGIYNRHPLVFLVEAADDICYQIMDIEDAHKLKILSTEHTKRLLMDFFDERKDANILLSIHKTCSEIDDTNEQIAYLRSKVIGKLIYESIDVFMNHYHDIMAGEYKKSLIENISIKSRTAYSECSAIAFRKLYNHRSVVEIEIAGYKILGTIMEEFVDAAINFNSYYSKQLMSFIPEQYKNHDKTSYSRIMMVLDFISGMTDVYALDLYRKIRGINLPDNY